MMQTVTCIDNYYLLIISDMLNSFILLLTVLCYKMIAIFIILYVDSYKAIYSGAPLCGLDFKIMNLFTLVTEIISLTLHINYIASYIYSYII